MIFPYNWTLKDAIFQKNRGTVFSTFSCGGGSTMGYKLAGFDVIGCNEIDPKMIECYIANHHPKYPFLEPIQKFKLRESFPDELYNLDILDGSPPCSSFSMAGNREKDWGKEKVFREGQSEQILDTLFFDYIDLAEKFKPKVCVAENVEGLLMGDAIDYVRKIYAAFEKAGYIAQHFLLDSSTMGVPQKRKRVFFIALRKDLAAPFMRQVDMFTELPYLELNFKEPVIPFGKVRTEKGKDYSHTERGQLMKHRIKTDKSCNDINERVYQKKSGFNAMIWHDEEVATTITAGETNWRYFDGMACSDEDYIVCGTFPRDYNFLNAKSESFVKYMVGMSVPPVMVAQIANQIYIQWLSKL